MNPSTLWTLQTLLEVLPKRADINAVEWAEKHVRLPGSARSEAFDSSITPWSREPLATVSDQVTRICTICGPVQSGKSSVGEAALCYILATQHSGDIQYNWENDEKALDRWGKRIDRILRGCKPVMARAPSDRHAWQKCLVMFPHANLTCQGVFTAENLDSDSIRFQLNEEIHSWPSGRLEKAYNRTTAFWNSYILNISNAGCVKDQLHEALLSGTNQCWEVKCPGCGLFHAMQTRWDEKHPELGGLRYDSEGCKTEGGYDYNRLVGTIRYQMPCGYEVHDTPSERRELSLSGRYSAPQNPNAIATAKSYTFEAVSVDYIPWLKLIQAKHAALKAMRYGDPEPWIRYLQERECRFWDAEDRPLGGRVTINTAIKKDREGLKANPLFAGRFFALDRQQGSLAKGELPHWWLVIRDALSNGDSLLVFEGKLLTDEDVIGTLDRHECIRSCGVADSGDDTTHVYQFCLRNGINAIKGSGDMWFSHPNNVRRIFSVEKPLHSMVNAPPTASHPSLEPAFWFYSKAGIRERLHWLRQGGAIKWEVPSDVSEDYQRHMESEEIKDRIVPRTGERVKEWVQIRERNDLFVCECYNAMLMEMAGLIGAAAVGK